MKLTTKEDYSIQLEEVYNSIVLLTEEKDEFSICMRDNGFEFFYGGKKFEAKNGVVKELGWRYRDENLLENACTNEI